MEKRKKTLLILGLCIFTLTLIGLSYAFWQITLQQTDENVVYTDCLKLDFKDENAISLQNAYPMTEEEQETFFASETPYHFTITNQCESKANLSINIETLEVTEEENPLYDEWVDVILYEGKTSYEKGVTEVLNKPDENGYYKLTASEENQNKLLNDSIKAYTLHSFTIEKNEEKDFSMYLLLDEETPLETEDGKKTTNAHWKGKVTINAAYKPPVSTKGTLRKIEQYNDLEKSAWNYKEQITKIVFENELNPHNETEGILSFDESMNQDRSVMSYLVPTGEQVEIFTGESKDAYTAYIQGDGGVKGNIDSSYLFYGFYNVESINDLEYFDTSQVENMSYMFSVEKYGVYLSFSALTSLDLSTLDTSSATDMNHMFYNLNELQELILGEHFDTSKVTDMNGMFESISAITSIDLSQCNFDTRNVTDMSGIFSYMSALKTLNLGNYFNLENATDIRYMFSNMDSLTSLDLGENFNASSATDISGMFSGMDSLTSLDLGDNFNASSVTDMSFMFYNLPKLTTLNLGKNFNSISVTDMSSMFYELPQLTTLNLGDNFVTSSVTDMGLMFTRMNSLISLDLGANFNTSSVTDMGSMFNNLPELTELNLGENFDTSNVEDMSLMFQNLTSLETLDLGSHFNTSNVTSMNQMFKDDSSLTHIDYGEYFIHKEDVTINRMFDGCPDDLNKPEHESWRDVVWN